MVTNLAQFKADKATKEKPVIPRRRVSLTAGALLSALADCEANDLRATMTFDLAPDDMLVIESFIFHLRQRTEDRKHGYQRSKRIDNQPAP